MSRTTPALLTTACTSPNFFTAASTMPAAPLVLVMSPLSASARAPISSATVVAASARMSFTTTLALSAASAIA